MRFRSLIPFAAILGAGCVSPRHTTFQWASSAAAQDHVSGPNPGDFSPANAVGPHHVMTCGDDPTAWGPGVSSVSWLDLTYARFMNVTRIQVFETWNPGAIIKVDVEDSTGVLPPDTLWQSASGDGTSAPCPGAFVIDLNGDSTFDQYDEVRVWVQGSLVSTTPTVYPEIDAVSLEGYL